jgi:hypothetical protein
LGDHRPLLHGDIEGACQFRREILHRYAQLAASHRAVSDDLLHQPRYHIGGNGETDADITAAGGDNRGVDPDQFTAQVDQRSAGVAGVDRSIGLDEILITLNAQARAAQGADDPGGHGLPEAERIADGDHEVADTQAVGIGQRQSGQVAAGHLDYRHVAFRIGTDHLGFEPATVVEGDHDGVSAVDDVVIGDDETPTRVHYHSGADALRPALARLVGDIEKWRKNGSSSSGLRRSATRLWVAMFTTAGVARSSMGARVGSGWPSTAAGRAAWMGQRNSDGEAERQQGGG